MTSWWTPVISWQFRLCSVAPVTMSWPQRLFFLNSCHHVMAIFWARVLCHLVVEEVRFRTRVTLGVNPIRFLVYTKHVPGRLRSGSGVVPEWPWISGFMRKSSSRASAPIMRFSVLLNSCDNFLVTLPLISTGT